MLSEPLSLTVDGVAYTLPRINQDNYSAEYFSPNAAGDERIQLLVNHAIPTGTSTVESHHMRVNRQFITAGEIARTDSLWMVAKTVGAAQVSADLEDLYVGLAAMLEAATNTVLKAFLNRNP